MIEFLKNLFGTKDSREVKRISKIVDKINLFESKLEILSDEALKAKTEEFKLRLEKESLKDILPEAFATVREASKRVLGMRHFDVQLIGGVVLHEGKVAEMKTGEGKTLVATCPIYLNALSGKGVHVITVNDYLAKRDREWMGQIYEFLGLKVSVVLAGMSSQARREAYSADITYGTNSEFGFDYLRDNMSSSIEDFVQRKLNFAVVDEVDSILIDEARTPLIISGSSKDILKDYELFANVARQLINKKDYDVNEKESSVLMREEGISKIEKMLNIDNLYSLENVELTHYLNQALRAKELFKKDKEYIIKDGNVIIVDEFTGRLMEGRRYSDGLHQSIEAKERVKVAAENQTLATITIQNYFRMYNKLSGMTGTAKTEETELFHIYNLSVIAIPTNRMVNRVDHSDLVFLTSEEKYKAVVEKIVEVNEKGQPILVGTASIESSELISSLLKKRNVRHQVLNAKYHEKEAEIIADAGKRSAVTIATNMAGRGTDIVLGGSVKDDTNMDEWKANRDEVVALNGLFVLGTERHESRRIDDQLRGRSGRQGDPGESLFYISLEDDLMRMFGSDKSISMLKKLGYKDNEPVQHYLINRAIANAQKRVEARNFSTRKQLLEYDDVVNKQREIVYNQRYEILTMDTKAKVYSIFDRFVKHAISIYLDGEEMDLEGFKLYFKDKLNVELENMDKDQILKHLLDLYEEKMSKNDNREAIERDLMIRIIDSRWRENLANLDALREGIHLRSYGQQDPIVEYKLAASRIYASLGNNIREEIVSFLFKLEL